MDSCRAVRAIISILLAAFLFCGSSKAQTKAAAGAKQLTVERIYSQPSLSESPTEGLEWKPNGKGVSFLRSSATTSKEELWEMDVTTGEKHKVIAAEKLAALAPAEEPPTQRTGLGRLQPVRYIWSPDGNSLLFVHNDNLILFNLSTQSSKQLLLVKAPIQDPKFSPDGRWVSFLREHNLSVVNLDSGKETQLTRGGNEDFLEGELDWVYPEELDLHTAYWWSPDSSRLAFLEMGEQPVTKYPLVDYLSYTGEIETMRYPKAGGANPIVRVGVVGVGGGKTRWIDTGSDTDIYLARVAWLPDGKRLAIERLNRAQNRLDLMLANADDGAAQVILTETDKYWVNVSDDLYFFADSHRFLWSSERTGFRHFYLYDIGGNLLEQLTRGDWEVTGLEGVDEDHGVIYFTSTEKSPLESHFYRLSLADKKITRLTQAGTHMISLSPDAGAYVDTYSNSMTPPRVDLFRSNGSRIAAINENRVAELADYHLSPVEFFTVPAANGTLLNAMIIKPPDFDPARKYSVIVWVYGGPHAQMVRNAWGGPTFLWHQMMAQRGFLIFAVDNRGSAGRGHAFETPIYHQFGKVELADQLAGVSYLKSLPYVNPTRIGMWGGSYGGFMTLMGLFNAGEVYKAGFAMAPVTDWQQYDTIYTERYMGKPQDNPEGYKQSSPVTQAAQLKGKLLIAHGTGDDNVHFANSMELANTLIHADKYAELSVYPGRGHGMSDAAARIQLFQRVTLFFLENLQ